MLKAMPSMNLTAKSTQNLCFNNTTSKSSINSKFRKSILAEYKSGVKWKDMSMN